MSANGLHRIRWRRVAVARIHRTAASQFARDLVNIQQSIVEEGVENVGKRPLVLTPLGLTLANFGDFDKIGNFGDILPISPN